MSSELVRLLDTHLPTDRKERDDLAAMRAFARTLGQPFARAQWLGWDEALARADETPLRRLLDKARALARR